MLHKQCMMSYMVFASNVRICWQYVLHIHNITHFNVWSRAINITLIKFCWWLCCAEPFGFQSKVDHIVSQARAGQTTARIPKRGIHANRPNWLSCETTELVKEHIRLYPAEPSHYSRSQNPNRLYLSPQLNICEMYRQYHTWAVERQAIPVSQSSYRYIFCAHFNLGFWSPRSDTCSKCEAIDSMNTNDITRHKQLVESAFEQQRQDKLLARSESGKCYITFNLQKTLPLPKLAISKAFYLRQLWIYNLGIHLISHKKNGSYFRVGQKINEVEV